MQDGQGRGEEGQHPASLYGAGGPGWGAGGAAPCSPVWYSRVSGGREGPCIYSLSGAGGMGQGSKVLPLPTPKCHAVQAVGRGPGAGWGNSPSFEKFTPVLKNLKTGGGGSFPLLLDGK